MNLRERRSSTNEPAKIEVIVVGGGGHARVVIDTLRQLQRSQEHLVVLGYLDDKPGPEFKKNGQKSGVFGVPHLGTLAQWIDYPHAKFHLAIGNNIVRQQFVDKVGHERLFTIIHPTAFVSEFAIICCGCLIGANAVVNCDASVGVASIVNSGAIVEHDAKIGNFVHLSYGSIVSGGGRVEDGVSLQPGAVVARNQSIKDSI